MPRTNRPTIPKLYVITSDSISLTPDLVTLDELRELAALVGLDPNEMRIRETGVYLPEDPQAGGLGLGDRFGLVRIAGEPAEAAHWAARDVITEA